MTTKQRKAVRALRRAIRMAGGRKNPAKGINTIAALCGVTYSHVWNWLNRDLRVPPEYAPKIEKEYHVPKEELSPDFPWSEVV